MTDPHHACLSPGGYQKIGEKSQATGHINRRKAYIRERPDKEERV